MISQERKENCHLHITGALGAADLRELGGRHGIDMRPYEPLESHYDFSLPHIWAAAKALTSVPGGFLDALERITDREAADGVGYAEVTFNPSGMLRRGMDNGTIATTVALAAETAAAKGVELKVKCGINRKDGPASVTEVAGAYQALPADVRVAIDLNGDELQYPTGVFVNSLVALPASIPLAIHAGELPGSEASLAAALRLNPIRLAHAVGAARQGRLLKEIARRDIAVEVAPTSNRLLGATTAWEPHPARTFADHGIAVLAGTDDPAFFNTTLSGELALLAADGVKPVPVSATRNRT